MELRKLDALVAEKVMGWSDLKTDLIIETGWDLYGVDSSGEGDFLVPNYSTDIAAAWEVVEKMGAIVLSSGGEYPWCACFNSQTSWSDTAPQAICLAALKAKGINVSGWEK